MSPSRTVILAAWLVVGIIPGSVTSISAQPARGVDEYWTNTLKEIASLQQKVDRNRGDLQSLYKIGVLYERLLQWQDAIGAYQRAIEAKPDFAYAHYNLGWCQAYLGKYEEALKAHQQALAHAGVESIKLKLTAAQARYAMGWDYYRLRRYNEAIESYLQALTFDPQLEEALYEVGRVLIHQGGNRQEVMTVALKLGPNFSFLLLKEQELVVPGPPSPPVDPTEYSSQSALRSGAQEVFPMSRSLHPTITYKEKALYTSSARDHRIQGVVKLQVVFAADGKITQIRIVDELPYGLTAQAILAVQKIRFTPARLDGQAVSVRGHLELSFNLY